MNEHLDRFAPLSHEERAVARVAADQWTPILPVPVDAPKASAAVAKAAPPGFALTKAWKYLDAEGRLLGIIVRYDRPANGAAAEKTIRGFVFAEDPGGKREWRCNGFPEPRPLYNLDRLAADLGAPVVICEGEKATDAAATAFPHHVVTTSPGGAQAARKADWTPLRGRRVLIWPDCDGPGELYASAVANTLAVIGCTVSVVDAAALAERLGVTAEDAAGFDAADAAALVTDPQALREIVESLARRGETALAAEALPPENVAWPEPTPLPDGLPPVAAFEPAFLPDAIAPWAQDIAERMQCPLDFVAIPAVIALGATLGRKVAVRPQSRTNWSEVPNLWGCIVGRPGAMKSPALAEAMRFVNRLEATARKENEAALSEYAAEAEFYKLQKEAAQKQARKGIAGGLANARDLMITAPDEPKARRYVVSDATYESLGEILADNPNGALAFRDELVSLLKTLDREEYAAARGFFLTAWNGTSPYSFDRITRGKTRIEACCLSLIGSTQPGRLADYIGRANSAAGSDDGLIQRFSLLVWPDQSPEWREIDRYPDSEAHAAAWAAFHRLDTLGAAGVGAQNDDSEGVPFLRLDSGAQGAFGEWRADLEARLRSGELTPALESHLSKFRKTVPALALITHLADGGAGPIAKAAMLRALCFAEYLETHARRAYGAASEIATTAARAILKRIRKGDLRDGFSARDIYRSHWADLSDRERAQAGLDLLADFGWLRGEKREAGGRPTVLYSIHPGATP